MVMIDAGHAEWAVVDRLRQMLVEPPHQEFNVTQSYSLCVGILAWVMQRVRTPENNADTVEAKAAVALGESLKKQKIEDLPWALQTCQKDGTALRADFLDYSAFDFLVWLRNGMCHGDARQIIPINQANTLIGFQIRAMAQDGKERKIFLRESDLRRLGEALANAYCNALKAARGDNYFEQDAKALHEKRQTA